MSPSGSGAPNAAGLPATRSTRSRSVLAQRLAREQAPLERPERRVPLPVRRHAVDDLLDHVAGLAERRDHVRDSREIGGDLEAADPVAVDERAAIAVGPGAGIVEGVDDVAVERVEPGGEARPAEATRRHDHAVEALTVDRPTAGDAADGRVQPDPVGDAEVLRVGAQIRVDLLGGWVKRKVRRRGKVRERGHRAARVRPHARPHAAVGRGRVPLAAEIIARLEDRHVEARFQRMLGGDQTARASTDDRHARTGSQPHPATLSDRTRLTLGAVQASADLQNRHRRSAKNPTASALRCTGSALGPAWPGRFEIASCDLDKRECATASPEDLVPRGDILVLHPGPARKETRSCT